MNINHVTRSISFETGQLSEILKWMEFEGMTSLSLGVKILLKRALKTSSSRNNGVGVKQKKLMLNQSDLLEGYNTWMCKALQKEKANEQLKRLTQDADKKTVVEGHDKK